MLKLIRNVICTGALAAGSWILLSKTRTTHIKEMEQLKKHDYAHRGLHDKSLGIPENSLLAFRRAMDHGFGMELDVHLTRDGKLAVIHDASLKRVCGADVFIEDLSLEEARAYRLYNTDEKIPTLEEVLELVHGAVPLIIEVKPERENEATLCERVSELLDHYTGAFCLESFDPRAVFWFRRKRPAWVRGQLTEYFGKHGNKDIHPALDFALHNVLFNILTRPDFLAYNTKDRGNLTLRMCRKLFSATEADWTIRTKEQYDIVKADGAVPIFEGFIPRK